MFSLQGPNDLLSVQVRWLHCTYSCKTGASCPFRLLPPGKAADMLLPPPFCLHLDGLVVEGQTEPWPRTVHDWAKK
jgi:hypothetical protein